MTDDEGRENEGDLVMAAEKATPELVNMMIHHARGLHGAPMTEPRLKRLGHEPHGPVGLMATVQANSPPGFPP